MTRQHGSALRALTTRTDCTDAVVAALETWARPGRDARLLSDLAAAYLVRAQRQDRPVDLLAAFDAARRATAAAPQLEAPRFNLALAEEALGLSEAVASWEVVRRHSEPHWAAEAGEHSQRLMQAASREAATRWPLNRGRLAAAVRNNDRRAVAQLVEPFPAAAQRYLEEEVLPAWATAADDRRVEEAQRLLDLASAVGAELARSTGDPYLGDATRLLVEASRSPSSRRARDLRAGYLALGKGRLADHALDRRAAAEHYRDAERAFRRAGSPSRFGAQLSGAVAESFEDDRLDRALVRLAAVERQVQPRGYRGLLARVQSNSGFLLIYQGRLVEALASYEAARASFERNHDLENLANVQVRKIGIFRTVGEPELAWREAFQSQRHAARMVVVESRHHLLGETAASALALGHPEVALLYQSAALRLIEDELAATPPEAAQRIQGLRGNLAIARRARAAIQLRLERHELAQQDLAEAVRLSGVEGDESVQRAIRARVREVEAQSVRGRDPRRAIAIFTDALDLATPGEYRSFRANLLVQRAAAHRAAGDRRSAEHDWRLAIAELGAEEQAIVRNRRRGQGEEIWTAYFSRFQEAYRDLIGQLADEGRAEEAFEYAERARAFEPLSLVAEIALPPRLSCPLSDPGQPLRLRHLQACLPAGTLLVEYSVLGERTLIWLVATDHFELLTVPVGAGTVAEWTATLQREAEQRNESAFEAGLDAPFAALVGPVLARLALRSAERPAVRRLVFVPDGAMHGLPLAALRDAQSHRHLVERFPLETAASAAFYVFSLQRDEALPREAAPRALLIGDPSFDTGSELTSGLDRLPRARSEVQRIGAFYAPDVDVLVDEEATSQRFLELAPRSSVVHIAGHALANPAVPSRSLLLLAPSKGHSGALFAEEILTRVRLGRARLVVLSACSSAGGHPVGPLGLAGLVRPLFAAGTPAVLGSLWNVGEDPTEALLVEFHRHYRAGHDAATALRLAQLYLLEQKGRGLRSVLAWSSFAVVGHASSPFPPSKDGERRDSP